MRPSRRAAVKIVEIGGPEPIALDELARRALSHDGDARSVVADPEAPYFGTKVKERSLVPGPDARLGRTHFADWLAHSPMGRSTMSKPTIHAPPIVLIHGLWMTARSWDNWAAHYRDKGHQVIVPTYPGFEIEVEGLREKPEVIAEASVPATLDHLASVVESLDRPPIIMGHSFGGTFTQLLVNRGMLLPGVLGVRRRERCVDPAGRQGSVRVGRRSFPDSQDGDAGLGQFDRSAKSRTAGPYHQDGGGELMLGWKHARSGRRRLGEAR